MKTATSAKRSRRSKSILAMIAGKPTPDDNVLWSWVKRFVDLVDHSGNGSAGPQASSERLEKHYSSGPRDYPNRLKPLHRYDIQNHRKGRNPLHVKSRYDWRQPTVI